MEQVLTFEVVSGSQMWGTTNSTSSWLIPDLVLMARLTISHGFGCPLPRAEGQALFVGYGERQMVFHALGQIRPLTATVHHDSHLRRIGGVMWVTVILTDVR